MEHPPAMPTELYHLLFLVTFTRWQSVPETFQKVSTAATVRRILKIDTDVHRTALVCGQMAEILIFRHQVCLHFLAEKRTVERHHPNVGCLAYYTSENMGIFL